MASSASGKRPLGGDEDDDHGDAHGDVDATADATGDDTGAGASSAAALAAGTGMPAVPPPNSALVKRARLGGDNDGAVVQVIQNVCFFWGDPRERRRRARACAHAWATALSCAFRRGRGPQQRILRTSSLLAPTMLLTGHEVCRRRRRRGNGNAGRMNGVTGRTRERKTGKPPFLRIKSLSPCRAAPRFLRVLMCTYARVRDERTGPCQCVQVLAGRCLAGVGLDGPHDQYAACPVLTFARACHHLTDGAAFRRALALDLSLTLALPLAFIRPPPRLHPPSPSRSSALAVFVPKCCGARRATASTTTC